MTKKDYVKIAADIKEFITAFPSTKQTFESFVNIQLITTLQKDNPNFNRDKFRKAIFE